MIGDPNGSADGSADANDSQILVDGELPDGALPDGASPGDGSVEGSSPFDGGGPCGSKSTCAGGKCTGDVCEPYPMIPSGTSVFAGAIVADDGYAYFLGGSDHVYRVDEEQNLFAYETGELGLTSIAVANGNVYFANSKGTDSNGRISFCPTSGCGKGDANRSELSVSATHQIQGIAVTASTLYYADFDLSASVGGIYECSLATKACNTTPMVAMSQSNDLQLVGSSLYWLGGSSNNGQNGAFSCMSPPCSTATGTSNPAVLDFAVTDEKIYLIGNTEIQFEALTGSSEQNLFSNGTNYQAIATDDSNLYWLDNRGANAGELDQCGLGAGGTCSTSTRATLAPGLSQPHHLAVDTNYIYFTTDDGVFRLVK